MVKKLKNWIDAVASQLCFEPEMAQASEDKTVFGMVQDWLPWGEEVEVERVEGTSTIFDLWETTELARDYGGLLIPEWAFEDYVLPEKTKE